MTIICPKCKNECYNHDKFCSQCGAKLTEDNFSSIKATIEQFNTEKTNNSTKNKTSFKSESVKKFFENTLVNVAMFLIALLCAFCFVMFVILDNHKEQKENLQYRNYMENPSVIPLLKEPATYIDLANNIKDVEAFLTMYLKNSSDNLEKKNQIFSSYLKELDKLPNVLNEKFDKKNILLCAKASNINSCVAILNDRFSKSGINAFSNQDIIYLYPDYKFIKENFSDFLVDDYRKYVDLRAKYNYPISYSLELNITPKDLADKIALFEKVYLESKDEVIKESLEKIVYNDFRKFIFTPSIYSTLTQEMKPEYKNAYNYFIKNKKDSNLRAVIMSYMDKKRSYSEENFKNDYPYKAYKNDTFDENYKDSVLEDVFVQLRKNIFTNKNSDIPLAFVYDLKTAKWKKYNSKNQLTSGEYVLSEPDENNNVSIYNHAFSPMQELNILNYSKMYLISDGLYVFNKDKLFISKVTFNGKTFNLYTLNHIDITSLFPGIEVINIDSFSNYNTIIQKENTNANYIILARYSQGWNDYNLSTISGDFNQLTLPNMFSVSSQKNIILSFSENKDDSEEFIENKPTYKITIKTYGNEEPTEPIKNYAQYDEKIKDDELNEIQHKANIMPKMIENNEKVELEESLLEVPSQNLEPPKDFD